MRESETTLTSHILMFAVVSLKHFVNGLFCLAISLKGLSEREGEEFKKRRKEGRYTPDKE